MKTSLFSRHLPPAPAPDSAAITPLGWLVMVGLAIGFLALLYNHPIAVVSVLLLLVVSQIALAHRNTRRKLALAASRPGNPLCTFARSLNLRTVDPWVVRATFEELQPYFPEVCRPFPIRPSDRFEDDLGIDPDDMNDTVQDIATRAGYSLEQTENNPLYGKVETVGDLIQFFTHQPRPLTRLRVSASLQD